MAQNKHKFIYENNQWFIDNHDFDALDATIKVVVLGYGQSKHASRFLMVSPTFSFKESLIVEADQKGPKRVRCFYTSNPTGYGAGSGYVLKVVRILVSQATAET